MSADKSEILRWFDSSHLPPDIRETVFPFESLAEIIDQDFPPGPEKSVCLRKLLEAKDAAVRCAVFEREKVQVKEETDEERAERLSDEALQVLRERLAEPVTPVVVGAAAEGLIRRLTTPIRGGMKWKQDGPVDTDLPPNSNRPTPPDGCQCPLCKPRH